MQYSIDGGHTWHKAKEGVWIIYDNLETANEIPVELHINATEEGLITDVFRCKGDGGESEATESEMAQEMVSRLMRE